MYDIMLDIETLATDYSAVVLQVAMVRFDRNTGEIGDKLVVSLDGKSQYEKGRHIDLDTVKWWRGQSPRVINGIIDNVIPTEDALDKIAKFFNYNKDIIFCHATFDVVVLADLFKFYERKIPWRYTRVRDLRTLVDIAGIDLRSYDWTNKSHDSFEDCVFQVKYTIDAIKKLKLNTAVI